MATKWGPVARKGAHYIITSHTMKVVALVSGGKDSCYNMLQCVHHGHQIVALANLRPLPASDLDELDSFMFQTVGHEAVEFIAAAMELVRARVVFEPLQARSAQYNLHRPAATFPASDQGACDVRDDGLCSRSGG